MEWIEGVPTEAGKYWAWCKHDGDMMPVTILNHEGYQVVQNDAGSTIGVIGDDRGGTVPLIPRHLYNVFTHYLPWTEERPKPPRVK